MNIRAAALLGLACAVSGCTTGIPSIEPTASGIEPTLKPVTPPPPSVTPPASTPGGQSPDLFAVSFADLATGWVGGDGVVWTTSTGGSSWRRTWTGTGLVREIASFGSEVWALTAPRGDAAPPVDTLLRSDDGGNRWSSLPLLRPLHRLQPVAPGVAWAAVVPDQPGDGQQSVFEPPSKTADGGATWQSVTAAGAAQDICFNADSVWTVDGGTLARSTDAGRTWSGVDPGLPTDGMAAPWESGSIDCAGEAIWLLAAGGGAASQEAYLVTRSLDAGATWRIVFGEPYFPVTPPGVTEIDAYSGAFVVVSPTSARFVGWCPACPSYSITWTNDAGATSGRAILPVPGFGGGPGGIAFPDPDHGWLVATYPDKGGTLLQSTDAGATWSGVGLP